MKSNFNSTCFRIVLLLYRFVSINKLQIYKAVDMFPHMRKVIDIHSVLSCHVETVVMLSHKKPDSVINVKVEFGEGEGTVHYSSQIPQGHLQNRYTSYNRQSQYLD